MTFFASAAALGASAATTIATAAAGTALSTGAAATAATIGSVAGTAIGGGLAGAAIGAGGAALTGGDVGKGALMGGTTGALTMGIGSGVGAAVGGAASGSVGAAGIGALAGAAGGAAGAAVGGEDAGKGALLGGITGGIGAYSTGVTGAATGAVDATGKVIPGQVPLSEAAKNADANLIAASNEAGAASRNLQAVNTQIPPIDSSFSPTSIADSITPDAAPVVDVGDVSTYNQNLADATMRDTAAQSNLAKMGNIASTAGVEKNPNIIQKGLNLIEKNPAIAMQLGGAGLTMMGGSGKQQAGAPSQSGPVENVSPEFKRTIPLARPPQITTFADGGIIGNLPGGQGIKGIYDDTWGHILPKGVGTTLFGNKDPAAVAPIQQPQAQPQPQQQVPINPIYARAMQGLEHATQQGTQATQAQLPTQPVQAAAEGGIMGVDRYNLGGYAHGGIPRLLRGDGDGVSDSIPAEIGHDGKQPARLADGEFVFPARAVSELGNGSTEAGGKILQAAVNKIQARRARTTGKGKIAVNSKASKLLPV